MIQNFCAFSGLVNFFACASLAAFLYWKDKTGKVNRCFALWSLSVAIWSLGYFMWLFTIPYGTSLFWARFLMAGAIVIPTTYIHFTLVYLNVDHRFKSIIYFCYGFSVIYLFLDCTPLYIARLEPRYWFRWWPVPGPFYHVFQAYFVLAVIFAQGLLFWKAISSKSEVVRKQFMLVAIGTLIAYAGGSTNFFLWYNIPVPPVFNFLVTAYVAFIGYGIVHYGLWDLRLINVFLAKTVIFVLLYAVMLGFPIISLVWGKSFLLQQFGNMWWVVPVAFFGAMSVIAPFLYLTLQRKAEEHLLRDQRRYQQTLLQASIGMTLIKDMNHLLNLTVHLLTKTLAIKHASIYLYDEASERYERGVFRGKKVEDATRYISKKSEIVSMLVQDRTPLVSEALHFRSGQKNIGRNLLVFLESLHAAVIVPSFIRENLLGFLVLGEKRSRQMYTQGDLDTLSTLANQAALAIENCRFLEEFEKTQSVIFQTAKMNDIGTMASGIGHQMNNRLNHISVACELCTIVIVPALRKAVEGGNHPEFIKQAEDLEKKLKQMRDNALRGRDMVGRLLDFSRLSEKFESVKLEKIIETAVAFWKEYRKGLDHIDFSVDIPAPLPSIKGNFSTLEEVLINFLNNALDAVLMKEEAWEFAKLPKPENPPKGIVRVSACTVEREQGKCVEFKIEDTGIGMTDEVKKKMHVPFFTTKATSIKGTGLGMYLIKEIVKAHKGEIKVESEYGKGTTFRVYFQAI